MYIEESEFKNIDNKNDKIMIPVWEKMLITVEEAMKYSSLGRDAIYKLCNEPGCKFVLKNGRNTLIKRKEFEKFIESVNYI